MRGAKEVEAREAKRGLWADPNPVPPWEWRRRSRPHRYSKYRFRVVYPRFWCIVSGAFIHAGSTALV
jgi:hypothetical protein